MAKAKAYSAAVLAGEKGQRTFEGDHAANVAMPLGGIGAGCVCLNGQGGLQDFSIRHRPETTAMSERHALHDTAFAALRITGRRPVTKLVEGPYPVEKIYGLGLKNGGNRGGGSNGLPRFETCVFRGEYPFGTVDLRDRAVPLRVRITGFNPFIPLDDVNSGLPCAILEYTLTNPSKRRVGYEFSYHLSHLAHTEGIDQSAGTRNVVMPGKGVYLHNTQPETAEAFGSASLSVVGHRPKVKAMWFRGGWFDAVSALWGEVESGGFKTNRGGGDQDITGRNGGSILLAGTLGPGESVTYPIVIAWHFPNVHYTGGWQSATDCACDSGACGGDAKPAWRPFYVSQWADAREVALHVHKHYDSLRSRTGAFHDALFGSTLPSYVLDAVSANLAILKSPTVLRQENGNVWAWEGCFADGGCCAGSCTHVWNYAQAMPHLFPQLERTLREQELLRSMDEKGHVAFRSALPDGPTHHKHHAAADGQLGGIMKVYRDWQISGDANWLARMYPAAKRSLDYAIRTWDPDQDGWLIEPHHNTYDIEFWGPDGMCTSIYVGALSAMAAMAGALGKGKDAASYDGLATKAGARMDEDLFDGQYYIQKVMWKDLRDQSVARMVASAGRDADEATKLLKQEGPKYQYGSGCISDGVIGAWMASIYGLATPQSRAKVRRHLKSIFDNNFRADLSGHACTQRPGYAMGHEAGLLLCTWPRGGKPTLPFVYSDEVWTGIEYQVASHLIEEGMVAEGLTVVKAVRDRYDGRVRNPWNEYECGNYYARAMASYALLGSLSGLRYSAVSKTLRLAPRVGGSRFRTFFATASGWGTVTLAGGTLTIAVVEGTLAVGAVEVLRDGRVGRAALDAVIKAGARRAVTVA